MFDTAKPYKCHLMYYREGLKTGLFAIYLFTTSGQIWRLVYVVKQHNQTANSIIRSSICSKLRLNNNSICLI